MPVVAAAALPEVAAAAGGAEAIGGTAAATGGGAGLASKFGKGALQQGAAHQALGGRARQPGQGQPGVPGHIVLKAVSEQFTALQPRQFGG